MSTPRHRCGTSRLSLAPGDTPALQRLLDVRPQVFCDSVHGAITGVIQQTLVTGYPAVELISKTATDQGVDPGAIFDRVHRILVQSWFLDADAPISETA